MSAIQPERVSDHRRFEYHPLETDTTLRLIKVLPKRKDGFIGVNMFHVHFPESIDDPSNSLPDMKGHIQVPQYKCLSYTWGDSSEKHEIFANNDLLHVRKNLFEFLQLARESDMCQESPLWIDALCINQNDISEKNHQVQRMGSLYASAKEVLVFLGHQLRVDSIIKELKSDPNSWGHLRPDSEARRIASWNKVLLHHDIVLSRQIEDVCGHPYWGRAWIAQEILLHRKVKLLVGSQWINWLHFGYFLQNLRFSGSLQWAPTTFASYTTILSLFDLWSQHRDYDSSRHHNFWTLLSQRSEAHCHDLRDRIYSLLALVRDSPFQVDYFENNQDLFWRVGEHYEAWSNLYFVAIIQHALQVTTEQLETRLRLGESSGSNPETRISVAIRDAFFVSATDSKGSDHEWKYIHCRNRECEILQKLSLRLCGGGEALVLCTNTGGSTSYDSRSNASLHFVIQPRPDQLPHWVCPTSSDLFDSDETRQDEWKVLKSEYERKVWGLKAYNPGRGSMEEVGTVIRNISTDDVLGDALVQQYIFRRQGIIQGLDEKVMFPAAYVLELLKTVNA